MGPDGIPNILLKTCAEEISYGLSAVAEPYRHIVGISAQLGMLSAVVAVLRDTGFDFVYPRSYMRSTIEMGNPAFTLGRTMNPELTLGQSKQVTVRVPH